MGAAPEQDINYDWLGNTTSTDDDAHGFYDRSLGTIKNDSANGKPYQLVSASNASKGGDRTGSLDAKYDVAGNLTDLAVNRSLQHNATCLPTGSGCNQTFHYQWDEVGRLVRAQRWDIATTSNLGILPPSNAAADLSYTYDASDNRVLKTATALEGNERKQRHSVYISGGQELRGAQFDPSYLDPGMTGADYEISSKTEVAYLFAHGVRLGRVAVDNNTSMPTYAANAFAPPQHVLINLDDTLGSTSIVIDRATGELVEGTAYLAHGATESDYRPERWAGLREDYRFTGKEEDVEVGLEYFGKRFLSPYIGRWVSADPLAVHMPGGGDANLYTYVVGHLLKAIDLFGLDTIVLHGGGPGGPNGVRVLSEHVRQLMTPAPYDPKLKGAALNAVMKEYRPSIEYDGIVRNGPNPGTRIAETYKHPAGTPKILAGFSMGGDAALRAGGPNSSGGGEGSTRTCAVPAKQPEKWDLRVVAGAEVDDKFVSRVERAAETSKMFVIVGLQGDTNMHNDGAARVVGPMFGDRSYEAIVRSIEGRYGTLEKFYKAHPNVSIQKAEGPHGGGGNRESTLDAVTRGVSEVQERQSVPGPVGSHLEQSDDTSSSKQK